VSVLAGLVTAVRAGESRDGLAAAAPALRQAASAFASDGISVGDGLRWGWLATVPPLIDAMINAAEAAGQGLTATEARWMAAGPGWPVQPRDRRPAVHQLAYRPVHLSKVFAKLGISSRGQLHNVLPGSPDAPGH